MYYVRIVYIFRIYICTVSLCMRVTPICDHAKIIAQYVNVYLPRLAILFCANITFWLRTVREKYHHARSLFLVQIISSGIHYFAC